MGLSALFGIAFVTALSGALAPGPVLFATVHGSAAHGRWAGPLVVAGHAVVEIPLMVAIILGLGGLLSSPDFAAKVGLAGGIVLIVMGGLMIRDLPRVSLPGARAEGEKKAGIPALKVVGSGALTSLSNPYFPIWWATIGLTFIVNARPHGLPGYAVFYTGHILADLAWFWAVSESVHRGRRFLSQRSYKAIVLVCAVLLMAFGAYFAFLWNPPAAQ